MQLGIKFPATGFKLLEELSRHMYPNSSLLVDSNFRCRSQSMQGSHEICNHKYGSEPYEDKFALNLKLLVAGIIEFENFEQSLVRNRVFRLGRSLLIAFSNLLTNKLLQIKVELLKQLFLFYFIARFQIQVVFNLLINVIIQLGANYVSFELFGDPF
ncbi:hypothetical protein BpHYR1_014677 [Brachionus plicatilis]|uniref:Uncharacterized protein n=1 Tax=Brachionus plicatilis TaxID=10195 RepID=A0A3M7RHH2_BRAPC|nr:hypothetical protein BpHYR1_014677 [Brachionus plicatilis]